MYILVICFSLIMLFLTYISKKYIPLPLIVVNLLWALEVLIIKINILDFYPVDEQIYFMIFLFLMTFNFTILTVITIRKSNNRSINTFSTRKIKIDLLNFNKKIIVIFNVIIIIILIIFFKRILIYFITGDFDTIRSLIYFQGIGGSNELFKSGIDVILVQWICQGGALSLFLISLIGYMIGKFKFNIVVLSTITNLLYTLLTSGRMLILSIVVILFITIYMIKWEHLIEEKNTINIKRKKKKVSLILVFLFICIIVITFFRIDSSASNQGIIEQVYIYLTAPIFYFNQLILQGNYDNNLWGWAIISGGVEIVSLILDNLLNIHLNTPLRQITAENQVFLNIGDEYIYNAITTMFFTFYKDFGNFGSIFYGILLGLISGISYNMVRYKTTILRVYIYSVIIYCLFMGIISWELLYPQIWIFIFSGLMYIRFFINREKLNQSNKKIIEMEV